MKFVYGITDTSTCPVPIERDLVGERRRIDKFKRNTVVLGELPGMRDEERDIAGIRFRGFL